METQKTFRKTKNKNNMEVTKLPEDNHNIEGWIYNTLKRSFKT